MNQKHIIVSIGLFLMQASLQAQITNSQPVDKKSADEVIQLSPFTVSQKGDRGYNAVNTLGASRMNTEIKNTPMSVVVINQQFIQDNLPIDAYQAVRYTSGVSGAGAPYSGQMTLRGQNTAGATYSDGIVDNVLIGGANMISMPLIDRIELIKGPAGTLYGSHNSGGIVNVMYKKPLPVAQTILQLNAGLTLPTKGFVLDNTGPLNDKFNYRLILAGDQGKSFRGDLDSEATVGLSGDYKLKSGGSLYLQYNRIHPVRSTNSFPWFADKDYKISTFLPRDQPIGERDSRRDHVVTQINVILTQPFKFANIDWTARFAFRNIIADSYAALYESGDTEYGFFDKFGVQFGNRSNASFADPRFDHVEMRTRSLSQQTFQGHGYVNNIDVVGDFNLGPVKNKLLIYGTYETGRLFNQNLANTYAGINLAEGKRVYYIDSKSIQARYLTIPVLATSNRTYTDTLAAASQINSSMLDDKLIFVFGFRKDQRVQTIRKLNNVGNIVDDERNGTSKKFGLVARPITSTAFYYNYAETFLPQGFTPNGDKWPNLIPINNEAGIKWNSPSGRFVVNLAHFKTVTDNVLVFRQTGNVDQNGVLISTQLAGGQLVVKGWESDFTAAINENISIFGGIGNLTSVNALGVRARAVPQGLNWKAFIKYSSIDGIFKGAFIGYGYEKNADRAGDSGDGFNMPGYTVADMVIGYKKGRWSTQINITNLMDDVYASISVAPTIIYGGDPRNIRLSTTYRL